MARWIFARNVRRNFYAVEAETYEEALALLKADENAYYDGGYDMDFHSAEPDLVDVEEEAA